MRPWLRSAALIVFAGVGCSAPAGNSYLDVTVGFGAGVNSRCVKVVVSSSAGVEKATRAMRVSGTTPLRVVVYRDDLPATVSVQAQGFADDACDTRAAPVEESPLTSATFRAPPTEVAVVLERAPAMDADHDGFSPPSDCNDADPAIKPGATEVCDDGKDNDCSAGADCADPSCATRTCGTGAICADSTCHEQACSDGIDGDGDGTVDCADPDCDLQSCGLGSGARCASRVCGEQTCADGVDNDGDGATDCSDSDCDFQVCGTGARCTSNLCAEQSCIDGVDNDGDGARDCADPDCAGAGCGVGGTCTAGVCREPLETICNDGVSNDADALADCADPDCASLACSDGNACTSGEVCTGSSCGGGTATICGAPPGACFSVSGTCAPATGLCSYGPLGTAAACDDADPCSTADHCNGDGGCVSGPKVCGDPPSACFAAGLCQASLDGGCSYAVLTGGWCSDGNNCTSGDSCAADGGCASGTLTTCTAPECFVFTAGDCEVDAGCRFAPAPATTTCTGGMCSGTGTCVPTPTFPFMPDNFVPTQHPPSGAFTIDCALAFNSGPDAGFGTPCSGMQLPDVSYADGGAAGELAVLSVSSLFITDAGSLTLSGSRPVVIAVFGSAGVHGPIFANSSNGRFGPGASSAATCTTRAGGPGKDNGSRGGGGGGAGFYTFGAIGGGSNSVPSTGGDAGADDPNGDVPLLVGCPGGTGKTDTSTTPGGVGGGAFQLSVAGTLTVNAIVSTSAEGGRGGTDGSEPGGGGGGSAGAINLQANRLIITTNARITANGGAGGGGAQGGNASPGEDGSTTTETPAVGGLNDSGGGPGGAGAAGSTLPVAGTTTSKGGGGGGGAMGRIFFKHFDTGAGCSVTGNPVISPPARRTNCP